MKRPRRLEEVFFFWVVGEQEPLSMALVSRPGAGIGQGEAPGQGRWMAVETEGDSVCEKQLSGAAPAIHLTSDQARREWRYFFTFCMLSSFTHTHTRVCTHFWIHPKQTTPALGLFESIPPFTHLWNVVFFKLIRKITEPWPTTERRRMRHREKWIPCLMKQKLNVIKDGYPLCEFRSLGPDAFIARPARRTLHRVCYYFPDIICVPIFGFLNAALWGQSTISEPQCNRKQMQSLIMQANVHRLASLMASHRQRAYRTYGAV